MRQSHSPSSSELLTNALCFILGVALGAFLILKYTSVKPLPKHLDTLHKEM